MLQAVGVHSRIPRAGIRASTVWRIHRFDGDLLWTCSHQQAGPAAESRVGIFGCRSCVVVLSCTCSISSCSFFLWSCFEIQRNQTR